LLLSLFNFNQFLNGGKTVQNNTAMVTNPSSGDAFIDSPGRRLLYHQLRQAIAWGTGENKALALLIMDLDRFREVNHTLGHRIGDLLLQQIGPRLQSVLEKSGSVMRLGGDEFAVLMEAGANSHRTIATARDILKVLEEPFVLDGLKLDIQASIGIAFFPDHGSSADTLLQRADVALYAAKASKSGYAIYTPDQNQNNPVRLALVGELRRAIVDNQLFLLYQPKIDLQTGQITGVEALVRWRHPRLGVTLPDQFIPLAERTGLIMPLTLWVLHEALRQCHKWHQAGIQLNVAVNISMLNLQSRALPDQLNGLLKAWEVPPDSLGLEITESTIMADPARTMEIVRQMSEMGLQLAIDDFGTGYSSLAYLSKLPIDEIKIDKSFVINMATQKEDIVIVRSTIDLAHNLGLKVVAEGVENQATQEKLALLGCDAAQGFHISRPLPADEITKRLNNPSPGLLERWLRPSRPARQDPKITLKFELPGKVGTTDLK
jgi:diguanylate cyclase (GGDEF)-like protein